MDPHQQQHQQQYIAPTAQYPPAPAPVEMVGSPAPQPGYSPAPQPGYSPAPVEMVGSPAPSTVAYPPPGGGTYPPPAPSTVSAPSEYNPYDAHQAPPLQQQPQVYGDAGYQQQPQQYPPTYPPQQPLDQQQQQHQQYYDPEKAQPTATGAAIIPGPGPSASGDGGFMGGGPTITVFGRTFPKKRFLIYVGVAIVVLIFIIGLSAGLAGRKKDNDGGSGGYYSGGGGSGGGYSGGGYGGGGGGSYGGGGGGSYGGGGGGGYDDNDCGPYAHICNEVTADTLDNMGDYIR